MSKLIKIDSDYQQWISSIAQRFRQSQLRAAVRVNGEMLHFYWSLGRDISKMHHEASYGSAFYKSVSEDLHNLFPDVHSFSPTNLKYMRYFYELYPDAENRPQAVDELGNRPQVGDDLAITENRPQAEDNLWNIPWGHHKLLIDKCKGDTKMALFYVHKSSGQPHHRPSGM